MPKHPAHFIGTFLYISFVFIWVYLILYQHKLIEKMVSPVPCTERLMQRYNIHGHRLVVGCIPYRYKGTHGTSVVDEDAIEVLVITSQRKGKGMLFPKGGWEKDESIIEAVLRETLEEAGVIGEVECELGKWNFKGKNNDMCYEGYMFSLLVKEELDFWPEKDVRQRKWVTNPQIFRYTYLKLVKIRRIADNKLISNR
ncbi:nudix hydrolase 18, mitochondrial-like [Olea europaea subsp. europaea]|uniref:Nudix hydrolase 18, mitochondrial-like n=1 Tax=Olea europaea subsp. europaea TaxID=158383 RepID=A0A8S0RL49_OLEEU|nr:nudix hydrolase 18, mitochondrial-like [Olea europaea subsp. europaea]